MIDRSFLRTVGRRVSGAVRGAVNLTEQNRETPKNQNIGLKSKSIFAIGIYRFRLIFGYRRKGIQREEGGGGAPDRGRFDLVGTPHPEVASTH